MSGADRRRAYHSPLRQEQAEATRRRIIEAAAQSFIQSGYAGTTMKQIAANAGVSVERVYGQSSKADLLLRAFRLRYVDEHDWDSVLTTTAMTQLFSIDDPEDGLTALAAFLSTAHARSSELWVIIRAVALSDRFVAQERERLVTLKRESFQHSVRWLMRIGVLPEVPEDRVRDLAATINVVSSAETYLELRHDWQLSETEYQQWLTRAIVASPYLPANDGVADQGHLR